MKKTEDYPATHSMDTEWFAVDRNGRIAWLDSMQEGCVPEQFFPELQLTTWYDFKNGILQPPAEGLPFVRLPIKPVNLELTFRNRIPASGYPNFRSRLLTWI
jgi:hypothetical protein